MASRMAGTGDVVLHSRKNSEDEDDVLLRPFKYLMQVPGKNVRRKLSVAFNQWLRIDTDKVELISDIVHILHNASLLLDDIEDNSELRRGKPVAHKIFGVPSTINAANYVIFIALERVLELGHPDAVRVFSEQMLELHRGQGMEIFWRDSFICPTEENYKIMVQRKTGGLFNLAVRLMHLFSAVEDKFGNLVKLLGLFFQIRDDYANLCFDEYAENKSFGEDLTEGKFSFPIIHAISTDKDDSKIMSILRQRTTDLSLKKYCISLLKDAGSLDYTKNALTDLEAQIRKEIGRLGGNPILSSLMDELAV